MFNLSTGAQKALLSNEQQVNIFITAATISMGDGDGAVIAGADTINDSGSGFGSFAKGDFVLIMSGDANHNTVVKVLDAAADKLEVVAGSFSAVSAGSDISVIKLENFGTFMKVFQNSTMKLFTGTRPVNADAVETGTELIQITKDGGTFAAGVSTNGLNVEGDVAGTTLNRATDPATAATEVWQGTASNTGTAGWGRWYANEFVTGASTTAIRIDGVVNTSGADINMAAGTTITASAISNVTSVSMTAIGA